VNKSCIIGGSDGSAARGGASDLSEWQRSVGDDGVRAEERTGHRNRTRWGSPLSRLWRQLPSRGAFGERISTLRAYALRSK